VKIEKRIERNGKILFRAVFDLDGPWSVEAFLDAFRAEFAKKYPKISLAEPGYVERWERIGSARWTAFDRSPRNATDLALASETAGPPRSCLA
jgi:hypothetical protein